MKISNTGEKNIYREKKPGGYEYYLLDIMVKTKHVFTKRYPVLKHELKDVVRQRDAWFLNIGEPVYGKKFKPYKHQTKEV